MLFSLDNKFHSHCFVIKLFLLSSNYTLLFSICDTGTGPGKCPPLTGATVEDTEGTRPNDLSSWFCFFFFLLSPTTGGRRWLSGWLCAGIQSRCHPAGFNHTHAGGFCMSFVGTQDTVSCSPASQQTSVPSREAKEVLTNPVSASFKRSIKLTQ